MDNDNSVHFIKNIYNRIEDYKKEHDLLFKWYTYIYNKLTIGGIILGPFSVLLTSLDIEIYGDQVNYNIITMINMCISMVSSIIFSILKFGMYEEKSLNHQKAYLEYDMLQTDIMKNIKITHVNNPLPKKYIDNIVVKYTELRKKFPITGIVYELCDDEQSSITEVFKDPIDELLVYEQSRMNEGS